MGSWIREKPESGMELLVPVRVELYLVGPYELNRERRDRILKSLKKCLNRGRREGRHDAMRYMPGSTMHQVISSTEYQVISL